MAERKIIFECRIGSHLYGTNSAQSDEDFMGVFLPSASDLLSLHRCPEEWVQSVKLSEGVRNTAGDVDRKYWSLQRFMQLARQGQPGAIELFFAPEEMVLVETREWLQVKKDRAAFLSRNSIVPFLKFAAAQAHKASIKGENLLHLRALLSWMATLSKTTLNMSIAEAGEVEEGRMVFRAVAGEPELSMALTTSESGAPTVTLAGRQWDTGSRLKWLQVGLEKLEAKYGSRSALAAASGHDWKSLSHAYRLLFEAEELLRDGLITLPLPEKIRHEIVRIKRGGMKQDFDFRADLDARIERLTHLAGESILPENTDGEAIEALCQKLLLEHLNSDFRCCLEKDCDVL
jgi:hypothetical protein